MHPPEAAPERNRRRSPRWSGRPARPGARRVAVAGAAFWVALVLAVVPLVHDGARAIDDGWRPVGDEAFVAMAVHDVFTTHTPLIGMPALGRESPGSPYLPL